jgi:PAS domain S-box-containing protein
MTNVEGIAAQEEHEREPRASHAREQEIKAELLQSEERMRLALDTANIGYWDLNLETGEMTWSHAVSRQMGLPGDSPTTFQAFMNPVHPDDRTSIHKAVEGAVHCDAAFEVPYRAVWPDGSLHWRTLTGRAFYGTAGSPVRVVGAAMDIEELKAAEDRLGQAAAKYRALFEDAAVGIFHITPEGQPVSVNRTLARMCGYDSPEQFMMAVQSVDQLFADRTALQGFREGLKKGVVLQDEYEILCRDGSKNWVLGYVRAIRDTDGKVVLHEGMIQDIKARKEMEGLLREKAAREEQLTTIIGMVPGAIYSYLMRPDGSATMPFASSRLHDILGSPADTAELDAAQLLAMIHPDDRARVDAAITDSFRNLTMWHEEFRVNDPQRGLIWVKGHASPQRQQDESVLWHGFLLDVTETKQLESHRWQSRHLESIARLVGGIAHSFNNMMTVVIGYSDVIAETLTPSDPNQPRIAKIKDVAHQASAMTAHLLAFGRLQPRHTVVMDLNAHIAEVASLLRRLLGEDIQLLVRPGPNLWTVSADPTQIDQVLMHLAGYARVAIPHGGRLVIETQNVDLVECDTAMYSGMPPGPYVMISLADNGAGFSAEAVPYIFEPFGTAMQAGKESGLGLCAAYGIIKQSGGFIGACSEMGVGTTFKVYLPRCSWRCTKVATPNGSDLKSGRLAPKTILLVEDDPALREIANLQLQGFGCTVLQARNGSEAIRIAEQYADPIDLLMTDVVMPDMDGRELAGRLRQKTSSLKVLFVSGYTVETMFRAGRLDPGAYFIHKPYRRVDLDQRLHKIFET